MEAKDFKTEIEEQITKLSLPAAELLKIPVPRPTQLSVAGWINVIMCTAISIFVFNLFHSAYEANRHQYDKWEVLEKEGIEGSASIVDKESRFMTKSQKFYEVTYDIKNTNIRHRSAVVSQNLFDSFHKGDSVPIIYLPNQPTLNRLKILGIPKAPDSQLGALLWHTIPLLIPFFFALPFIRGLFFERRLLRYGKITEAQVMSSTPHTTRDFAYNIARLQYKNETGEIKEISARTYAWQAREVGSTVNLLSLPKDPDVFVIYPTTYVRVKSY